VLHVVEHVIDDLVERSRRIADGRVGDERIHRAVGQGGARFIGARFLQLGQLLGPIVLDALILAQGLDELVGHLRQHARLDGLDLDIEARDPPLIARLRVLRVGQFEGLLITGAQPDEGLIEAGQPAAALAQLQLPVLVFEDGVFADGALDVHQDAVADRRRPLDHVELHLCVACLFQRSVDLGLGRFGHRRIHTEAAVVVQLDSGRQRHDQLEGHGVKGDILQSRLRVRANLLRLQGFGEDLFAQVVQDFAQHALLAEHAQDGRDGRLAGAEAGDAGFLRNHARRALEGLLRALRPKLDRQVELVVVAQRLGNDQWFCQRVPPGLHKPYLTNPLYTMQTKQRKTTGEMVGATWSRPRRQARWSRGFSRFGHLRVNTTYPAEASTPY